MMLLRGGMNVSNLAQEDREKEKKKRKMMLIVLTFVLIIVAKKGSQIEGCLLNKIEQLELRLIITYDEFHLKYIIFCSPSVF